MIRYCFLLTGRRDYDSRHVSRRALSLVLGRRDARRAEPGRYYFPPFRSNDARTTTPGGLRAAR